MTDNRFSNKIAIVVPTRNRPYDLRRMLLSVANQSCIPDELIVVDGSDETIEHVLGEFPDINIKYFRVYPPSLSKQRNVGMDAVDPSIKLAGYFDDDLVLDTRAIEMALTFWETASDTVGGTRFNIVSDPSPKCTWLKSFFLLDSRYGGNVLRSGQATLIGQVSSNKYVNWLSGGVTIWRREVIEEFTYDEWFQGTGYLEDVDYSFRVGKKYQLVVLADAKVQHLSHPIRKDKNYLLGKWQMVNRMYFVKKNSELSVPQCYWALFGQLLINLGKFIVERDTVGLRRALGNIVGLTKITTGKIERMGGVLK